MVALSIGGALGYILTPLIITHRYTSNDITRGVGPRTADGWIMQAAEVWVKQIRTLPVARAVLCTTDVPRSNSKHSYLAGLSVTLGKRISSGKSSQEKCNDIGLHCSGREGSFGVTK